MNTINVSIIVPVYNVEKYLGECLDSILRQDFNNYEIICINDASADASEEILRAYASQYEQIKVITHTQNRGLSAARNTGLSNARGKYIWFVDSDDMIAPGALRDLYAAAEEYQTDVLCFNITRMYDDGKDLRMQQEEGYKYKGVYSGRELFCLFAEDKKLNPEACRHLFRKDFLEDGKIEFYNGIVHEDMLFSFLCSMKAKRTMAVSKNFYIYQQRNGSIMSTKDSRRSKSLVVVLLEIFTYWNSHIFTERENQAIAFCVRGIFDTYQYYSCFGKAQEELGLGSYAEQLLYSMLHSNFSPRYLILNELQLAQIASAESVIVFGAGRAAMDVIKQMKARNIPISAVAVSDTSSNPECFCAIRVDTIENLARRVENAAVIIGVTEKNSSGIQEKLQRLGFKEIIIPQKVISEGG